MKSFSLSKYVLAGSGKDHEKSLRRLARDANNDIRRRIAENPACPNDVLEQLASDGCTEVRIAVALNAKLDRQACCRLCQDPDPDVRFMIAATSYIPDVLLRLLASDENPYVQARANRTIELKVNAQSNAVLNA